MSVKWSTVASIIYFSLYLFMLILLALHAHRTGNYKDKKSFVKAVWLKKNIYAAILVHLYDTATDYGVIIEWWLLWQQERKGEIDYKTVDMEVFVFAAISFLILYRIITIFISIYINQDDHCCIVWFDVFLSLIDMYIIRAVYNGIKGNAENPSPKQKIIQLAESVFESLPQVILQAVFIIRSNNDPRLRENSSIYLVAVSLIASILSVTNKFIWLDREGVVQWAQESHLKKPKCSLLLSSANNTTQHTEFPVCAQHKLELNEGDFRKNRECYYCEEYGTQYRCPADVCVRDLCVQCYDHSTYECTNKEFIRIWYILRIIWRFSFIGTRFIAWALIWTVLGGSVLSIFGCCSFLYWCVVYYVILVRMNSDDLMEASILTAMFAAVSLISNAPSGKYPIAIAHLFEVIVMMSIITLFAFNDFTCSLCANVVYRQATSNKYIMSFIISGWICMIIDMMSYFSLLYKGIILKTADYSAYVVFFDGLREDEVIT
eukprot:195591_1